MKISNMGNLVSNKITRQLSLVVIGNFGSAGFGALAVLIISKELSVADFGLFNTALSLMMLASGLTDVGTNASMITFASSALGAGKKEDAAQIFKVAFLVRVIVGIIAGAAIFSAAELLSTKVFDYSELIPLFKLTAFGILSISLLIFLKAVFQTHQSFKTSVTIQLLVDISKLLAVVVLIAYFRLNPVNAIAIFAVSSISGVLFGIWKIRDRMTSKSKLTQKKLRQLFSFSKWMFLRNVSMSIIPYIGIIMLVKLLDSTSAGIYGLAYNLTYIFPILIGSIATVLLPEVSRFRDMGQFKSYLRTALKISLYPIMGVIPILFFSREIITYFFGVRYQGAVPIFNLLLLSNIINIANGTIRICLYPLDKPRIVAFTSLASLVVLFVGCYLLIPILGTISPALLLLAINISTFAFLYIYVYKRIQAGKVEFPTTQIEPFKTLEEKTELHPRYLQ